MISSVKRPANRTPQAFGINRQSEQARNLDLWLTGGLPGGNGWLDLSGRANIATLTNGPAWVGGPIGGAVFFDGSDDYAELVNLAPINYSISTAFSLVVWFRTGSTATQTLVATANFSSGGPSGYNFRLNGDGAGTNTIDVALGGSGGLIFVTGPAVTNDAAWHCAIATYNGSNTGAGISLYLDGRALTPTVVLDLPLGALDNSRFRVGFNTDGFPQIMAGSISEVRTYTGVLSPAQVWALYDPATRYDLFQPVHTFAGKTGAASARFGDFNIAVGAV